MDGGTLGFILFILIYAMIFMVFLVTNFINRKVKDWFEVGYIFAVAYILYTVVGAWGHLITHSVSNDIVFNYYIIVIAGFISFSIGYRLFKVNNESLRKIKVKNITGKTKTSKIKMKDNNSSIKVVILALFVLFAFLFRERLWHMIVNFGSGLSYTMVAARSSRSSLSGPLSLLSGYFYYFMLLVTFYELYSKKRIRAIYVAPTILLSVYMLTSGGRTMLLIVAVLFGIYMNYCKNILKLKTFLSALFLGVAGMVAIGHLRATNNIGDMFSMLTTSENMIKYIKLTSSGEFYNTTGTLFKYIEAVKYGFYEFNWGYSYIVEILVFIPYFLFKARPTPLPEQFMIDFYPAAPAGTGHGWFILNDGFMSLGIAGVIVEMFLFGIILSKIYKWYIKNHEFSLAKFLYGILIVYIFMSVRNSVLSAIKTFLLDALPFLILLYYEKRKFKKNQTRYKLENEVEFYDKKE